MNKVEEELQEVREAYKTGNVEKIREELGDLLFSIVNFSRMTCACPTEEILAEANGKFQRRFRSIESALAERHMDWKEADAELLDELWKDAKEKGL